VKLLNIHVKFRFVSYLTWRFCELHIIFTWSSYVHAWR